MVMYLMVRPKKGPIMNPSIPFTEIKRSRLYEEIADQIKGAILTGQIKPGERLPSERELSETFNVGRPAIREALRSLTAMGLIEVTMGKKGSTVKEFDIGHYMSAIREQLSWLIKTDKRGLQELWEVRKYIELGIAHAAAANATKNEMKKMELLINRMESSSKDIEKYFGLAVQFHETLAQASKNRIFYIIWGMFEDVLLKGYLPIINDLFPTGPHKLLEANRLLLNAIKSKDSEGINRAMEIHARDENFFSSDRHLKTKKKEKK
jgi:GntR family transcriptional regulator, transcriptional repressor for pyruvate dehydrogenase complex